MSRLFPALFAAALLALPATAGDPSAIETEISERLSWQTPPFAPDQAPCADLKACTAACREAAMRPYGGSENWPGAHACEVMGDMWADGRAHKKGKKLPDAGMRSWYSGCYMGNQSACEKEGAYYEGLGDAKSVEKSFAIRAAACFNGYEPSCLSAAAVAEKHKLPVNADVLLASVHVPACDDEGAAESCAWADAHPEIAAKTRETRALFAAADAALAGSSQAAAEPQIDPQALRSTHRTLWTGYPFDLAPGGGSVIYHCFEVWMPKASPDSAAIQATVAEAKQRYGHAVPPDAVTLDRKNPRAGLVVTPCWGKTRKVLVE